jgi:hypothetical protein
MAVIQIQKGVAGVPAFSIRLNMDVAALPIANVQESNRRLLSQLSGAPEPFARECRSGGLVNQPNQVKILGHRRELSTDGQQREKQTTIKHKHNTRRTN